MTLMVTLHYHLLLTFLKVLVDFIREQDAQRLEAQAVALGNTLADRDSRLRPKPKKQLV